MVGVVRSHNDDNTAMIEVEFHNSSVHHSFSIPNHHGNTMASLSEACLVLACPRNEGSPSQLQCVHFSSWDSTKDWTLPLPSKEVAIALSLGSGWIAVATNKQMLRVFSLGGMQHDVISIPGVIVGVAGWGSRLAIIYMYQEAPCTENVFQLKVWVLDVKKRKQLSPPHSLPLSLHSKLEWFGFSEGGYLVAYDTKGVVRLLDSTHYGGLSWIPILDLAKQAGNQSDHYFMVGMTHDPPEIRAVLCKGLQFPPVHPKPVMSSIPIHLPLCEPASEKTQLEDKYLQEVLLRRDGVAKAQELMKMFALACKSDHNYRAWEVAEAMDDEMTLNMALTYASRTQHHLLARNISDLIQQKANDEDGDLNEVDIESESEDTEYRERRTSALKQRVQLGNGASSGTSSSKWAMPRLRINPQKQVSKNECGRRYPSNGYLATCSRGDGRKGEGDEIAAASDETRELFSDGEEGSGGEEEGRDSEGEEEGRDSEGEEGGRSPPSTPTPLYTETAATRRANPFKMTTPESRRVQTDRKSSFLDNIGERAQLEERQREQQMKRKREHGREGGRREGGGRGGRGKLVKNKKIPTTAKKTTQVQSSLKSSLASVASSNHQPSSITEAEGERVLSEETGGPHSARERLSKLAFKSTNSTT